MVRLALQRVRFGGALAVGEGLGCKFVWGGIWCCGGARFRGCRGWIRCNEGARFPWRFWLLRCVSESPLERPDGGAQWPGRAQQFTDGNLIGVRVGRLVDGPRSLTAGVGSPMAVLRGTEAGDGGIMGDDA